MTSYGSCIGGQKILFTNAYIKQVSSDTAAGTLQLKALYDGREYYNIFYNSVYYSQFDESAAGQYVSLAEEVDFPHFKRNGSRASVSTLIAECGDGNEEFLDELNRRGYSLFVHYIGKTAELLVIAKEITIT